MISQTLARLRTHQSNVLRYRRLLTTRLMDHERSFLERRLSEEQASVEALLRESLPERLCGQTTNPEISALLNPADAFSHPMDVVEDGDLTLHEKRAILSSWAADVCAVKDDPETRACHGATASFDDVLDALRELERRDRDHGDTDNVRRTRPGPNERDGQGEADVL